MPDIYIYIIGIVCNLKSPYLHYIVLSDSDWSSMGLSWEKVGRHTLKKELSVFIMELTGSDDEVQLVTGL